MKKSCINIGIDGIIEFEKIILSKGFEIKVTKKNTHNDEIQNTFEWCISDEDGNEIGFHCVEMSEGDAVCTFFNLKKKFPKKSISFRCSMSSLESSIVEARGQVVCSLID